MLISRFHPAGRWHFAHLHSKCFGTGLGIGIDRRIGIIRSGRARHGQDARGHKPREIIDMAIGVIIVQTLPQPQHPIKAQIAVQALFNFASRKVRIAIGVEQALLSRGDQTGAVTIKRAAFQHPVCHLGRKTSAVRQFRADLLIPVHQILAAPAVKAKALADLRSAALDYQGPSIAQPDIAVTPYFQRHRGRTQRRSAGTVGFIADHQPHLLPAIRHRAGERRDLFLRAAQIARPFIRQVRKAHPQPALRMPFGRHDGHGYFPLARLLSRTARNSSPLCQLGQSLPEASIRPSR